MRELESSKGRIRMVAKKLEKSNLEKAPSVISMLGLEAEFIAKMMKTVDLKFDTFLSHVQKSSADLCGRLSDALSHSGLTPWFDMNASKLDTRGIIEGVLNSKVFTVVLTKGYFERKWCLFEYSIALLANKPMVGIYEADSRFEGGELNDFNIPKQFNQFMSHEIIKIDRRRWNSFFSSFEQALKERQKDAWVLNDETEEIKRNSNILTNNSDIKFLISELRSLGWKFGGMLFSSRADGMNAKAYRDKCIGRGAILSVIKRKNGIIFGGFVPYSSGRDAPDAWLFDLADVNAPKVLGRSLGKVQVGLNSKHGPRIYITLSPSGNEIGFGIHGMKGDGGHYIEGVFAGNITCGHKRTEIEEYEVFQILKSDMYATV